MAAILVRQHPIEIYYLTGEDAEACREALSEDYGYEYDPLVMARPCFVTSEFGGDGFCWRSPAEFEEDWAARGPGSGDPSFAAIRERAEAKEAAARARRESIWLAG